MPIKNLDVIILAAGLGKRMLSDIPKTMHKIAGKFMLQHLIDSVIKLDVQSIYIVYNNNLIPLKENYLNNSKIPIYWVLQNIPKGTGDAIQKVLPMIQNNSEILILYGDVPLVSFKTLKKLKSIKSQCDLGLLTAKITEPNKYGRIIRDQNGKVSKIMEYEEIININYKKKEEINSGIFITVSKYLKKWVKDLTYQNSKNELYLTDIVSIAYKKKYIIRTINPINVFEIIGINNKLDLIKAEREYQKQQAQNLLMSGVIVSDPNRFDLRGTLVHGTDVYIDVNVIIEGNVRLGNRVQIGANCILKNSIIEDDVVVYPFSIIESSKIDFKSKIGPFSRLRPGTKLQNSTQIGNFVELKNIQLGKKSKVGHLTYLGDAKIGNKVNIGAGTIICNYDGITKHQTNIEDNVFIGADSQLIAPILIEKNAVIGAGTTVTKNVASGKTIISRIRQFPILNKKNKKN